MSFTVIEDRVKSLTYNQSVLSSTQDSAGSIATPQEADFDDEQPTNAAIESTDCYRRGMRSLSVSRLVSFVSLNRLGYPQLQQEDRAWTTGSSEMDRHQH